MPTLQFNLSEAEIEKLNYERYAYPDPMVQKRIFAIYLKATLGWNNSLIGEIFELFFSGKNSFDDRQQNNDSASK